MNLTLTESINLAILNDIHRHSQRFIAQAIKEWDRKGTRCFPSFIRRYLALSWYLMTQSN